MATSHDRFVGESRKTRQSAHRPDLGAPEVENGGRLAKDTLGHGFGTDDEPWL